MSEGKANAQAGHAYVDALLSSLNHFDEDIRSQAAAYASLRPGTKICLDGGSIDNFDRLSAALQARGIPHVTITDSGHIEPPHFDGSPVVTAIGIGPINRKQAPKIMKRLPLWSGGARVRACRQSVPNSNERKHHGTDD
jgi:PTH2 family peptidyl-tRNA hydrolase